LPYKFNFNLTYISQALLKEIAKLVKEKKLHMRMGETSQRLAEKFRVSEITGLPVSDTLQIIEDLVDIQLQNLSNRDKFLSSRKRALLLPHCSRKYLDKRCQASFNPETSSYNCQHCSPDCLINQATRIGVDAGYDVYVLPGGSCINKIVEKNSYEGVVGVACCEEMKLGSEYLESVGIPGQAVPLIKNGCSNTSFNINSLMKIL
jgi:hypothetical protein